MVFGKHIYGIWEDVDDMNGFAGPNAGFPAPIPIPIDPMTHIHFHGADDTPRQIEHVISAMKCVGGYLFDIEGGISDKSEIFDAEAKKAARGAFTMACKRMEDLLGDNRRWEKGGRESEKDFRRIIKKQEKLLNEKIKSAGKKAVSLDERSFNALSAAAEQFMRLNSDPRIQKTVAEVFIDWLKKRQEGANEDK